MYYFSDHKTFILACVFGVCLVLAMCMIRYVCSKDMDSLHKAFIIISAIGICLLPGALFIQRIIENPPVKIPTTRSIIDGISNQQHVTDSLMSARLVHLEELCDSLLLVTTKNSKTENLVTGKDSKHHE